MGIAAVALAFACTAPNAALPRLGHDVAGLGLVIGAGHLNGVDRHGGTIDMDWVVAAYKDDDAVCTRLILGQVRIDPASCSSVTLADGLPDFGLSAGEPTIVEGLFDDVVVDVEVQLANVTFRPPLVSLAPIGYSGLGFALAVTDQRDFIRAVGYDARGREVRRI